MIIDKDTKYGMDGQYFEPYEVGDIISIDKERIIRYVGGGKWVLVTNRPIYYVSGEQLLKTFKRD